MGVQGGLCARSASVSIQPFQRQRQRQSRRILCCANRAVKRQICLSNASLAMKSSPAAFAQQHLRTCAWANAVAARKGTRADMYLHAFRLPGSCIVHYACPGAGFLCGSRHRGESRSDPATLMSNANLPDNSFRLLLTRVGDLGLR